MVDLFAPSDYHTQGLRLSLENDYTLMRLRLADEATLSREASKIGVAAGLVFSAVSIYFKFYPGIAFTFTTICLASWFHARTWAEKMEPEAQEIIRNLKEGREKQGISLSIVVKS